jgi:ATP/maltotriose-dependent transcriptional regulator MalT/DNA-binding SARP family transcriptional activator
MTDMSVESSGLTTFDFARDRGLLAQVYATLRPVNHTPLRHTLMAPKVRQPKSTKQGTSTADQFGGRSGFFLRTKLLPPRPAAELLSRPRLTQRLAANLAQPITLITANAGSGKTTFVADFLASRQGQFVWYQLDHTDADPSVFLGYIAHGIQQVVPGFGSAMLAYLQESSDELAQHPERAVDVLLNEVLEQVDEQLILVLDDYHHLGEETPVHAVLDRLLAYLPDVLHVMIISREMPPLSFARLRARMPQSIIDREDLLFTDEETQQLFRQVFDLELTTAQLAEYRDRTHGWITALQLVRQVAQRTLPGNDVSGTEEQVRPDLIEILRQSERNIFDYFAEEVFADEAENVQKLLLRISLLDRIELDVCTSLYPDLGCSRVLPALVRRNVFMTLASDGRGEEYRLHPLFQSFLRRRLRAEIGRTGVANEHQRYAESFLQRRVWEQAVRHFLAAEEFDRAARLVAEHGSEWIASGAIGALATVADALPPEALESYPRALSHRAEVSRLRGEFDAAKQMFRRAISLLQALDDREGEAEAQHALAAIARRQGQYDQAFVYLDRAILLTDEQSAVRMKCGNTRGLCLVALGQWTSAEREFREALQLAEERNDGYFARLVAHNLGTPAGIRGDFGEALRWLGRMLRSDGQGPPVPQEAIAHLNMARCYLYRGELEQCEQHLGSSLDCCQLFNLVALRGEILEAYGNLYRERRDVERAAEFYQRAARAYDDAGIDVERVELLEERAMLSLQAGDLLAARAYLDRLIKSRSVERDAVGFHTASLALGRVMIAQGEHGLASAALTPALEYFHDHGLYYYEAQACMAIASCDLKLGQEPAMLVHLRRAVDLALRYDYEYWLQREALDQPDLFYFEEAAEILPADLREQVLAMKSQGSKRTSEKGTTTAVDAKPIIDLTINLLGPVEIVRDPAKPLLPDAWTTRRARDILCFVASRRHHRASKDQIVDTFWGETDPTVIERNFHPTVSHIRKALNSNQTLKQNLLLYRDGDYLLNPEFAYRIDVEEFDRLVAEGESHRKERQFEQCIQCYQSAVDLYRGEFMQGSYDAWADEQRSFYRKQYLQLIESLASIAQQTGDWFKSINLAQKILQDDPFREDIHCLLMRAHAALGNKNAVKEQYESLKQLLQAELGEEPSAETIETFHELSTRRHD